MKKIGKKFTKLQKDEKGITLVALVITIVILIILATIAINFIFGNNGLITRTNEAKLETRAGTVEERKELWKAEKQTDKYLGDNSAQTLEELLNELEKENMLTEEEKMK